MKKVKKKIHADERSNYDFFYYIKINKLASVYKNSSVLFRKFSELYPRPIIVNITIEFMFAGINMFWARLRPILARAASRGLK